MALKVSRDKLRNAGKFMPGRALLMRTTAAALVSASALLIPALPASSLVSFTNPYSGSGYDVSYPQCSDTTPYAPNEFAIIGIGDGRPFSTNSCVQALWSRALMAKATSFSIYINTGNSGAYGKDITSDCAAGVPSVYTTRQSQQSWEIGCSEADYAFQAALNAGVNPNQPSSSTYSIKAGMWWADIENGNSWSANSQLNQDTIQGLMAELASPLNTSFSSEAGLPVGIYSNVSFWDSITGSTSNNLFTPTASNAGWFAGGSCSMFDANPAWVGQYASGTPSPVGDSDTAC